MTSQADTEPAAGFFAAQSWIRFWARLHPVLVHFPIALLIVAAVVEIARPGRRRQGDEGTSRAGPNPTALTCLGFGTLAAAVAAWSGWVNAAEYPMGSSVETTVALHRWIAIAAAGLGAVAFGAGLASRLAAGALVPYRLALVGSAMCVGAAGHFGGSLVYGDGYLLEPFEAEQRGEPADDDGDASGGAANDPGSGSAEPIVRTVDFDRDINPIFEVHCYDCHGPRRQRGKLRLDYREAAMRSEVILPGNAVESELYYRITLPPDDPDAMPPEEHGTELTEGEIALLTTWINEGALWEAGETPDATPATSEPDAEPEAIEVTGVSEAAIARAVTAIEGLGGSAVPIAEDSAALEVHFELLGEGFGDDDLAVLDGCADAVIWLSVAGTGVTDAGLGRIGALPNLRTLHLERTGIGDEGVAALASLRELRYLNLHSTAITGTCLEDIAAMPALEQVYLWNTEVTADEVELLRALRPELEVVSE